MSPLLSLYMRLKGMNDTGQRQAGMSGSPLGQYLYNSRMSPTFKGQTRVDSDGTPSSAPVFLDEGPMPQRLNVPPFLPYGDLPHGVLIDRTAAPPSRFRDVEQGGPAPPVDHPTLARMFGRG